MNNSLMPWKKFSTSVLTVGTLFATVMSANAAQDFTGTNWNDTGTALISSVGAGALTVNAADDATELITLSQQLLTSDIILNGGATDLRVLFSSIDGEVRNLNASGLSNAHTLTLSFNFNTTSAIVIHETLTLHSGSTLLTLAGDIDGAVVAGGGTTLIKIVEDGDLDADGSQFLNYSGETFDLAFTDNIGGNDEIQVVDNDTTTGEGPVAGGSGTIDDINLGNGTNKLLIRFDGEAESVFAGSGDDTIEIQHVGTLGDGGDVIDLGNGNNTISIADDSSILGGQASINVISLVTGTGNDEISLSGDARLFVIDDASTASTGELHTGAGADKITLNDTSSILTTDGIFLGAGNDIFTLNSGTSITSNLDLGTDTDILTVNGATITGNVTGTDNNTITLTNSTITGSINLGTGTDTLTLNNAKTAAGQAVSGVNVLKLNTGSDIEGTLTLDTGATVKLSGITGNNLDFLDTAAAIGNATTVTVNNSTLTNNFANFGAGTTFTANSSTLSGTYTLGTGTNNFVFNNTDFSGLTLNGAAGGTDTLTINGSMSGTLNNTITGIETYEQNSSGTWSVGATPASFTTANINAGTLDLNGNNLAVTTANIKGTLSGTGTLTGNVNILAGGNIKNTDTATASNITGNLDFATGSNIHVTVDASKNASNIMAGSVSNGGNVSLTASSFLQTGDTATIITAGSGIVGANFTEAFNMGVLTAHFDASTGTDLIATFERTSYADFATTEENSAALAQLDALASNATGETLDALLALDSVQQKDFDKVASQISGTAHTSAAQAIASASLAASKNVFKRINGLRFQQGYGAPTGAFGPESAEQEANNAWFELSYRDGTQDADSGNLGYDLNSLNYSLGYDQNFDDWILGAAINYGQGDVQFENNGGQSDIDSYGVAAYASKRSGDYFYDGSISLGFSSTDTTRQVALPGLTSKATSSADGQNLGLNFQAGRDFAQENVTFTPIAGFSYNKTSIDGFKEKGAFAVNVGDQNYDSLKTKLGGRISFVNYTDEDIAHSFELQGFWNHEILDDQASLDTTFTDGGSKFTVKGSDGFADSFETGIAYQIQHKSIKVKFAYNYEFSDTYNGSEISANLSTTF